MKLLTLLLLNFILCLPAFPQNADKQLPVTVEFSDNMILITLPRQYRDPSILPMTIPNFVQHLWTPKMAEFAPKKHEMVKMLILRLDQDPDVIAGHEMDYIKNIALYLFLSNNDVNALPQKARVLLNEWNKANISFKEEAKLVSDYLKMADSL